MPGHRHEDEQQLHDVERDADDGMKARVLLPGAADLIELCD